ncbi:biopolymer transporter ExbD [Novosphingobium sp.]|uniref:ExbD/TolR family protein n=1 Tax=Novosphingobium sp. TaxID=1874826 RepID=UPI0026159F8E|nr:biopolymer transporter ExbD [Novosphingobium sp.]
MGMMSGPGNGGGLRPQPMSEINVTPLVDVMLVLLIIFMVTAPLVAAGVDVDLPQEKAKQLVSDQKPVEISVDGTGQIFLGGIAVARSDFPATLQQLAQATGDPATTRIFVRADQALDYGFVMGIIADVSGAGFVKVAFLTDPRAPGGAGTGQ